MNLPESIIEAEVKYLKILESFFLREWGATRLWSHDLSHHRRVWNFAKELLQKQGSGQPEENPIIIEKLIIACFLHDIGMAIDTGSRHGQLSMELCRKFLEENKFIKNDFADLLFAVKMHDEKEYRKSSADNRVLQMLSLADDLDAFGYVGIYRYLEIYQIRGIHPPELGQKILENAGKRFGNFEKISGVNSDIVIKHRKRFFIVRDFFREYITQISGNTIDNVEHTGYPAIIRMISENLNNGRTFNDLIIAGRKSVEYPVIHKFFGNLESELS